MADPKKMSGDNVHTGFEVEALFKVVNEAVAEVKKKLVKIKELGDKISIGEMFEMQMLMNHLSQLSEMSTSVVSASNQAIMSMARALKQ